MCSMNGSMSAPSSATMNGMRCTMSPLKEPKKRMRDQAAHACRTLCRARVADELQRRRGTRILAKRAIGGTDVRAARQWRAHGGRADRGVHEQGEDFASDC